MRGDPIEFQLVGVKKDKFTIKMCIIFSVTCPLVCHGTKKDPLL
jgi:hypothetical protein